jgi:hypothetical protein
LYITFFGGFFNKFFNGFEISMKFCVFQHLFLIKKKEVVLGHISRYFFQTLKPNAAQKNQNNGSKKSKNVISKCVLDLNFAPVKGSVFFIF